MKLEDLIPFDPSIVPWETTPSDWALCIVPEPECRVWVEHALIRAVLEVDYLDDTVTNHHGMFVTIGGKVAVMINKPEYRLEEGVVQHIKFTGNPVNMRVGRFGGETFVFLPRSEFEE